MVSPLENHSFALLAFIILCPFYFYGSMTDILYLLKVLTLRFYVCAYCRMITTIKLLYIVPYVITVQVCAGVCMLMWCGCVVYVCIIGSCYLTYCVSYMCVARYHSLSDLVYMGKYSDDTCVWLYAS